MIPHLCALARTAGSIYVPHIHCDTCGQEIASLRDGMMEWLVDDSGKAYGLRIAHSEAIHCGCRLYVRRTNECNHPLDDFASRTGIEYWLARMEQGHVREPTEVMRTLLRIHADLDTLTP